jgi:hypothetical protein
MPKPAIRLYPVDVALLPRLPVPGVEGASQQRFAEAAATGALTRTLTLPAGAAWPPGRVEHWTELFVLRGALRLGPRRLDAPSYLSLAPGEQRPPLTSLTTTELLELREAPSPTMDKASVVLDAAAIAALPWERPDGAADGVAHQVLAVGAGGSMTRLLRVLPFVATGVFVHDHAEEVLLLEGSYRMADEFHATGTYTCKGPGVEHGPFLTSEGYLGLEVRNYA